MNLYEFVEPKQLKAGSVGKDHTPFYFDCADCDAKEPVIHGCLSGKQPVSTIDPTFGVIKKGSFFALAVFCETCFKKRAMDGLDHKYNELTKQIDAMKAAGNEADPEYMKLLLELRQVTADRVKHAGIVFSAV